MLTFGPRFPDGPTWQIKLRLQMNSLETGFISNPKTSCIGLLPCTNDGDWMRNFVIGEGGPRSNQEPPPEQSFDRQHRLQCLTITVRLGEGDGRKENANHVRLGLRLVWGARPRFRSGKQSYNKVSVLRPFQMQKQRLNAPPITALCLKFTITRN